MTEREKITFAINNHLYEVESEIPAGLTLNTYIRDYANLKGTKSMCKEGGCGACIVMLRSTDPFTKQENFKAVNSCLVPVWSCDGLAVTTIEGIGGKQNGYHRVQKYLAKFYGSQCGFCTPGMIMNMYSLLKSKPNITMEEIENSFGGNICRCTGYRPILDAFKALASDASKELMRRAKDIEDLDMNACSNGRNSKCSGVCDNCPKISQASSIKEKLDSDGNLFYKASSIKDVFRVTSRNGNSNYMLLAGNTAQGVYKSFEKPKVYIDISSVIELKNYELYDDKLVLGANLALTDCMELFLKVSKSKTRNFNYLKHLAEHIDLVANVPVRNIGTLAGNLMIKHQHNEFPSDLFVIFVTVGAEVLIESIIKTIGPLSLIEFLKLDMKNKIIKKIILPAIPNEVKVRTFKIMPRKQNVHAYVNAGFLFHLENGYVMEKPSIVFGGINDKFLHAERTESYLKGKCVENEQVLQESLKMLSEELVPAEGILEPPAAYKRTLSLSLFYRFLLGINSKKITVRNKSGVENLKRPLSKGKQSFEVNKKCSPIGMPVHKLEAPIQCSGEAEYVGDMVTYPGQLYGALVLARQARAVLMSINPREALKMSGVLAFYSAKDIPGKNAFTSEGSMFFNSTEELFCSGSVMYAGQPVGVIIAETQELAIAAAKKVNICYNSSQQPLLTIRDVLKARDSSRIKLFDDKKKGEVKAKAASAKHRIQGEYEIGSQYHFTLETQSCTCIPTDEGLNIYSATQWMDAIQSSVSEMLNIPENSINISVKRLGGGFGSKITRANLPANACALAAYKLNRPVQMVLDIETNMESIGKRCPALSFYEVEFDDNGKVETLTARIYQDVGCSLNDPSEMLIAQGFHNAYEHSSWSVEVYTVLTDNPSSAWMRAPGTIEGFTAIENIMEHIATVLQKDPLEIRLINLNRKYVFLKSLIDHSLEDTAYKCNREAITKFNESNRWKKRGISLVPVVFELDYFFCYNAMISIYAGDGTVAVTHGGIEMGQGLNTKVAQAVAYSLGVGLDMIKVKSSSNITAPNNGMSGASITSESCTLAALKCSEVLNSRLEPIKKKMKNASWKEIINEAFKQEINLNASSMNTGQEVNGYTVFGVGVTQVEVDMLTGNYMILKSDLIEDAGESMSPYIDIGQVEGAFVMGLGYFLMENIRQNPDSGMIVTNRTWNYWPPGIKDIPIDWNVALAKNSSNPKGVMRSKSTGEPPLCLALTAVTAIRDAIKSARRELGLSKEWFNLDQPCTVEKILLSAKTSHEQFTF